MKKSCFSSYIFQFFVNDTGDQLKNNKEYDILDIEKLFDKTEFDGEFIQNNISCERLTY